MSTDITLGWSPVAGVTLPYGDLANGEIVLLMSQAGTAGSTVFTDSAKGKTITATGTAWSASRKLFNKNTAYISNGGLKITDYSDFNFAAGQSFSIEFYLSLSNTMITRFLGRISSHNINNANVFGLLANSALMYGSTVPVAGVISAVSLPGCHPCWHHYAITRDSSGVVRGFVDGKLTSTHTNNNAVTSTDPLCIGSTYTDGGYQVTTGYLAELRIVRNATVYTTDFAMPGAFIPA